MSERVILAGSSSGSGKTTVACAALGILKACSLKVKAFKCGPDYIDPMFHLAALGASSENLDGFLCGNETLKYILSENSRGFDISVIEGAMGYYDGVGFTSEHSSYELSKLTGTPVIIIIDCAGIGATLGATLNGLVKYKSDSNIRGVIFNRISEQLYSGARELAENMGIESVGYLPKDSRINLESRHLGLKTAAETVYLQDKMKCLFNIAEKTIDVKKIISIASAATEIKAINKKLSPISENVVIAVANDNAFCFMYEDNLRVLSELGCDICFFSPLDGEGLPDNISGMYLGGGYPELYAKELSENAKMRESIFDAANRNMPFIAEGGGFMYLHECLQGDDERYYPMCGVIEGKCHKTSRPQNFGYINMLADSGNMLFRAGDKVNAHSFHYWSSDSPKASLTLKKPGRDRQWKETACGDSFYGGMPHLFFRGNPDIIKRFVWRCAEWKN